MTKVIWLGEDTEDVAGPSFTTCYGLKFPKDVEVEVADPDSVRRAKGNLYFKVIEEMKQENSHGESQTQVQGEGKEEGAEAKDYDYREREKGSGYAPVKKKVRKKKPAGEPAATRIPTPDP
jgi:hypothetical protein